MKLFLALLLSSFISVGFSQSIIEWTAEYELSLSDFQSPQTEINPNLKNYTIYSGASMDFSFHMSNAEFMFTKNFNSKVKTTFKQKSAVITAPDTLMAEQLISFGQYGFDLTELYARKFRREMYEKKGAFSNVSFFQPIFDKLQEEMNAESARVLKLSQLGKERAILAKEHQKVVLEIETLSDFCFECKPPKKKKKKG
jgi:hypothetical protein